MRVVASCLFLGTIVYAQDGSSCADAANQPECFEKALLGENCVWNSVWSSQTCVDKSTVNSSVYSWSWDGRPEAVTDGVKKTLQPGNGVTYYNDFSEHSWDSATEYGAFQTYVRTGTDGRPTAIGINIPADMDRVFPRTETTDPGSRFELPKKHRCSKAMPFDHVMFSYATNGHPGGYNMNEMRGAFTEGREAIGKVIEKSSFFQRHFDVDFQLDTPQESNDIKCSLGVFPPCIATTAEAAKFSKVPSPEYAPASLMFDPIANMPFKGAQWHPILGTSAEKVKDEYSPTMGSYDGRVVFFEALVASSSLNAIADGGEKEFDYDMPAKVQKTGYYPTKLVLRKTLADGLASDAQSVFQIEMKDMVFRLGDDALKGNGKLKNGMSEDAWCPAVDCTLESNMSDELCSTCGTFGVKPFGKRKQGIPTAKVDNSCECMEYCKDISEGYKFQVKKMNKKTLRRKKGKCTCLRNISSMKRYDPRTISAVFE